MPPLRKNSIFYHRVIPVGPKGTTTNTRILGHYSHPHDVVSVDGLHRSPHPGHPFETVSTIIILRKGSGIAELSGTHFFLSLHHKGIIPADFLRLSYQLKSCLMHIMLHDLTRATPHNLTYASRVENIFIFLFLQ